MDIRDDFLRKEYIKKYKDLGLGSNFFIEKRQIKDIGFNIGNAIYVVANVSINFHEGGIVRKFFSHEEEQAEKAESLLKCLQLIFEVTDVKLLNDKDIRVVIDYNNKKCKNIIGKMDSDKWINFADFSYNPPSSFSVPEVI